MPRFSLTIKDEDLGFDDLLEELEDTKADHVAVGLLGDLESEIVNIGFWNEFGTKDIPERPFIRQTFDTRRAKLKKIAGVLADKIYKGEKGKKEALEIMGGWFVNEIRESIDKKEYEPNADVTAKRKDAKRRKSKGEEQFSGSSKPLFDTGRLQDSLDYEVRKKGQENE
jgi:hypothetical protein